jgi:hypothetical protein
VFFTVAYLATRLGAKLEANFMRFVAVVVLILGVVAVDTGLNLLGSPYSFSRLARTFTQPAQAQALPVVGSTASAVSNPTAVPLPTSPLSVVNPTPAPGGSPQADSAPATAAANAAPKIATVMLNVTNGGYDPAILEAPANQPLKLALVTNNTFSCSRAFVIPTLNFQKLLPATGSTLVDIPAQPAGTVMYFTCSMGMYTGQIEFK